MKELHVFVIVNESPEAIFQPVLQYVTTYYCTLLYIYNSGAVGLSVNGEKEGCWTTKAVSL